MTVNHVLKTIKEDYFNFPLYIIGHPFKGFDEMKYEKKGKLSVGLVILALLCFESILNFVYTGFIASANNPYFMNSIMLIAQIIIPILLFVTANWTITTLIDGIGKYKEIFLVNMYALYLTLFFNIIFILLSNVLVIDEMPIALFFNGLSTFTYCLYLFVGLIVIHGFTFSKAIGSIILTFISMAIILFITLLMLSLIGEVIQFFSTVFRELTLKFL